MASTSAPRDSCVLAGLTASHEVSIFAPALDFYNGMWEQVNTSVSRLRVHSLLTIYLSQVTSPTDMLCADLLGNPELQSKAVQGTTDEAVAARQGTDAKVLQCQATCTKRAVSEIPHGVLMTLLPFGFTQL